MVIDNDTHLESEKNLFISHSPILLSEIGEKIEKIIWKQSYSVGVPQIDEKHQTMLGMIYELVTLDNNKVKIDEFLARLFGYMMTHLKEEELFLKGIKYPDINTHVAGHQKLEIAYNAIDSKFIYNMQFFDKEELMVFLLQWWNHHVLIEDKKYGQYIRDNNLDGQRIFMLSQKNKV